MLWYRCAITKRCTLKTSLQVVSHKSVQRLRVTGLYAIRGTNSIRNPSVIQRSSSRYKVGKLSVGEMVNINAHASKVHAMRLLNVKDADAPGFCRFPISLDQEFYDSADSRGNAKSQPIGRRGYPKIEWTKLRDRNEAWDLVSIQSRNGNAIGCIRSRR